VLLIHTMIILSHSHITIAYRVRVLSTSWLSLLVKPSPEELALFSLNINLRIPMLLVMTALPICSPYLLSTVLSVSGTSYLLKVH
jgi:hypothetical protein